MKLKKKIISCAALLAVAASCMASAFTGFSSSAAVGDGNDDWLHVEGNKIVDLNGNQVWLTGVNWFGFNCNEVMFHGLDAGKDFRIMASGIADHGFNIVRVPIATELIVSWMEGTPKKGTTNFSNDPYYINNPWFLTADGQQMNSMEIFDTCMSIFKEYGIKVLIDIHSAKIDNSGHDKRLWYFDDITAKQWQDSLVWLADKYKNDDTILAYDLKNEPHGKAQEINAGGDGAKWDGSTDMNNWRYAAQTCGEAIMEVNPNALILVEGVEVYPKEGHAYGDPPGGYGAPENYYGGWWGGNLRGVKEYPITVKNPKTNSSQLVYSPHEYGPSVYAQAWFQKEFTLETLHDDYMHDTWDYLQPDYPLLIGEWGGHMDADVNQKWMTILRDYMIDNTINHTFWCLNPNSGDTGGLLSYDWYTWDDEKYGLVEPSLWQTKNSGKFIGLDHQISLGENGTGLSLSEYHTQYATSEGSNLAGESKPNPVTTQVTSSGQPSSTTTTTTTTTIITTAVTTTGEIETNPTMPSMVSPTMYGDVNNDGFVNIADVVKLNTHLVNPEVNTLSDIATANADCVRDGIINTSDSALIMNYVAMMISIDKLGSN